MRIRGKSAWVAGMAWLGTGWGAFPAVRAAEVSFSRDVLPILSDKCIFCHGPDAKHRKADLRLDVEEDAKAPRKDGKAAIVPGDASASSAMQRLLSSDPDEKMPPPDSHKEITAAQIDALRRWIDAGAKWGRHWAFEPLVRPVPPSAGHAVDAFVEASLREQGLTFSPEAEKATLIRRVTLDLTGLPPTAEEVAAFSADTAPNAFEKLVDRLLASPRFGERMAWDWMEVARYADSNGYQGDSERTAWPWRDWVIKAFNENLPFDRFTVWQLAGDQLPNATHEQKLATGFLRNHPINGEGGRIPEENRIDYAMDMTETTGTAWLALTFNCCRCHDHKFDPLTKRDYYSVLAYFNQTPVDGGGGNPQTPPVLECPSEQEKGAIAEAEKAVAAAEATLAEARRTAPERAKNHPATWTPLTIASATAEQEKLAPQPDGSVLATDGVPDNDTFTLCGKFPGMTSLAAVGLEALPHASMTGGGLSHADSGNFVLTGLELTIDGQRVEFASAAASFEQGSLKAATAFDGDRNTGWAVYEGKVVTKAHQALFRLKQPVPLGPESTVQVILRHDSGHKRHVLGHFRLSATGKADAALPGAEEPDPQVATARTALDAAKKALESRHNAVPKVMVMADRKEPRKTFVLDKGLYDHPQGEVSQAVPAAFAGAAAGTAPNNRLALAQWLVSRENPLPARVWANRFWQMLFGIGIVKTSEDFGLQGEFPKHPLLLDWLAAEFRESGWDVKKLLRTMVTSRTYRQSSRISGEMAERDPENRLLAHGPRFRMPSWMIRDQALAVSGLLHEQLGGPPVRPYQPEGVWEEASFGAKRYEPGKGADLHRRSLYTFWRRIIGPTMFFDTGGRSVCTVKPLRTNTPLHALSTLNDVTYVEAARALADTALSATQDDTTRIGVVFSRALGRPPTASESAVLLAGLAKHRARFQAARQDAAQFLAHGEYRATAAVSPPELAAWAALCLTILNMDEVLTKE